MTLNPFNDDLGSSWTKSRNEKRKPEDDEPAEHYSDKDQSLWRAESLYGRQWEPRRTRRGRSESLVSKDATGPDPAA